MTNKIYNFVFLILLFFLQSCSGGTIANFLESSFKNNDSNQIYKKDNSLQNYKNNKNLSENKLNSDEKKSIDIEIRKKINSQSSIDKSVIDQNIIVKPIQINKNFNPKSYRIFVILKKVDPSFPIENFSKVLRNANINFEIEKIEIIPDLNNNLKINNKNL